MTTCDCGALHWFAGALSIWSDGRLHSPDVCLVTDDVSALSMAAAS